MGLWLEKFKKNWTGLKIFRAVPDFKKKILLTLKVSHNPELVDLVPVQLVEELIGSVADVF